MIKVALLGAGRMGGLHARHIAASPRFELAWIADPKPDAGRPLAAATGARTADLQTILQDADVHGIVIATSTDAHLADALACLEAGKAVFCEKPLSLSSEALRGARQRLEQPGLPPLFVAFNRRFDQHFNELRARIDSGEIGAVETIHIVNHDPASPDLAFIPRSGGLFRDFTIHDFDTAAWLLEEPIVEVFALASCLIEPAIIELGDVDTAKLVLRSRAGRLCLISNSRRSGFGYDQRIEAFGSAGALRVGNLRNDAVERWTERGARLSPIPYSFPQRYADAYRLELDHFADVIEGRAGPRTGYRESLAALELADAAALSIATGQAVTIPSDGAPNA